MQINNMFLYSIKIPLIILSFIIINTIIIIKYKDKNNIKKKYISKLNNLKNKNDIQEISKIIRLYISEEINSNITTYTLEDIKKLNNKDLTKLMKKCYKAEFSNNYKQNTISIINEAKELIISWK